MKKPRQLKADEMDVRVATMKETGCSLLIYKDARVDMDILDEWVGSMNWKREHTRDNANCVVSIWCPEKNQWISKEDTGTESMTEKAKGLASDSFKRACFNWNIGRELYTAPFVWVKLNSTEVYINSRTKKPATNTKFEVSEVVYNGNKIESIEIIDHLGNVRFKTGVFIKPQETKPQLKQPTYDELLAIALTEIEVCETNEQLKTVWTSNKKFQKDERFIKAKDDKKELLTK